MKTKVCYLVGLLFLLTTILGCRKKDDPKPDPPVLTPSLKAWASPESIAYNGTVLLAWSSENIKAGSLLLNGSPLISNNGNILSDPLPKDTVFIFSAIGINGQPLSKTLSVKVASPPVPTKLDTMLALFCDKPWRLVEISDYTLDGKYIDSWTLTKKDTTEIYYFYRDFSRANDRTAFGEGWSRTGPDNWEFTQNYTHIRFEKKAEYEFGIVLTASVYKRIIPRFSVDTLTGEKTPWGTTVETYRL